MRQAAANGPGHARSKYTVNSIALSQKRQLNMDFLRIIFLGLFLRSKGRRMLPRCSSPEKDRTDI